MSDSHITYLGDMYTRHSFEESKSLKVVAMFTVDVTLDVVVVIATSVKA